MAITGKIIIAALAVLAGAAAAKAEAPATRSASALQASLDRLAATLGPAGVSEAVLVVETPSGARRSARVGGPIKSADPSGRLFQIGSQTKWFTAAAILLLERDGALKLDDPVTKYLPDLHGGDGVLLRHLLTHTSGLGDGVAFLEDGAAPEGRFTFEELALLSRIKRRAFEPGARYEYNNFAFDVLGEVVAAASGRSREAFVQARILDPLGMKETYFGALADWPAANAARGYHRQDGAAAEMTGPRDLSWASAAGDMVSSADDLMRWLTALSDPGNPLGLTLDDFMKLSADSSAHGADMPKYGLGVMNRAFGGRLTIGHGGVIHGYVTYSGVDEASGVRFILLTATEGKEGMSVQSLLSAFSSALASALHVAAFAVETGATE